MLKVIFIIVVLWCISLYYGCQKTKMPSGAPISIVAESVQSMDYLTGQGFTCVRSAAVQSQYECY